MRKLKTFGLMLVVVLAVAGISASDAFASGEPTGEAVEITSGTGALTATAEHLVLKAGGNELNCKNVLAASVSASGAVEVSSDTITANPSAGCALVEPEELPWQGVVCVNGGIHTLWIFVVFNSPLGSFAGWIELPLAVVTKEGIFTATGATASSAEIGEGTGATLTGSISFNHSVVGKPVGGSC